MDYAGVQLRVLQGDVLAQPSDLLVLKYAQESYGADAAAVRVLGLDEALLPKPGMSCVISEPPGLAALKLLFLGVEPIDNFGYRSIREFSRRALTRARLSGAGVHEITMTLHGTGFGLDEAEAFESEIAGIIEALDAGDFPEELEAVSIVEWKSSRANRMRDILASLPPERPISLRDPSGVESAQITRRIDTVGYDSADRPHAFIAMPFAEYFEDIFYYGIAPPVRDAGFLCERIDKISFTGDVINRMKERITSSKVVVADLTEANPNVYLEVGYAWGVKIPCILICNRKTKLKFDLRGQRCLFYGSIMELEKNLKAELAALGFAPRAIPIG